MAKHKVKAKASKKIRRYREESAAIRCATKGDGAAQRFVIERLSKRNVKEMDVPSSVLEEMEQR